MRGKNNLMWSALFAFFSSFIALALRNRAIIMMRNLSWIQDAWEL
jgi:hypothetical protein